MSYDLLIERTDGELFARADVEAAVARFPQLRRYDAESYRSVATELVLVAERPDAPVEQLTLRLLYKELPGSFDGACDVALGLVAQLGGRVVDSQLGETITPESRDRSRAKAAQVAVWSKRLGAEFEAPPKAYVAAPTSAATAPARSDSGRPWWKFWARD